MVVAPLPFLQGGGAPAPEASPRSPAKLAQLWCTAPATCCDTF
eukprot:COSAG04_NODE_24967_length_314_cov_0.716279_1_plen_42_part_01